ncbi:MAG TPA: hypothetical protein VD884_09885 [Ohtaekwangia sp.]|nr:hypothetical protein [Ohtaekwangia sp.]
MKKYWIGIGLCLLLFNLQAQFSKGVIVDQHGGIYPGYLKLTSAPDHHYPEYTCNEKLLFKETKKGKREVLTVNDLSSFKLGLDTFLILKNYSFPLDNLVHNRFAKVILKGKGGIVCTFDELTLIAGIDSPVHSHIKTEIPHYVIFKNNQVIELTDYNFYYEIPPLISDYENLHQQVVSKQLQFKQIDELALKYEQWRSK